MEKQIEVNGVTIELTDDQVKKILEQTKVKDAKELVKQEILEILEKHKSNVRFLNKNCKISKYPTSHFEILGNNGEWLFDIDFDSKTPHFWYSYMGIYLFFRDKYSINIDDVQEIMKGMLEENLNLKGVTPKLLTSPQKYLIIRTSQTKGRDTWT